MTPARRERLILENLPVAEGIAHGLLPLVPPLIELDDLLGAARLALIQAIDAWNPRRSPLNWWIKLKIRAALLDLIRTSGPCGQRGESRNHRDETYRGLRYLQETIVEDFPDPPNDLLDWNSWPGNRHRSNYHSFIHCPVAPPTPEKVEQQSDRQIESLRSAVLQLPPRKRKLLELAYGSERSVSGELRLIGRRRRLRIGWRRVLREHREALEALRHALAPRTA